MSLFKVWNSETNKFEDAKLQQLFLDSEGRLCYITLPRNHPNTLNIAILANHLSPVLSTGYFLRSHPEIEIFEGDIIKSPSGFICKVFEGERDWTLKYFPKEDNKIRINGWYVINTYSFTDSLDSVLDGERIGNIYENPSLFMLTKDSIKNLTF